MGGNLKGKKKKESNEYIIISYSHAAQDIHTSHRQLKRSHGSTDSVRRCCVTLDNSTYLRINHRPAPSVRPGCRGAGRYCHSCVTTHRNSTFSTNPAVMWCLGGSCSVTCVRVTVQIYSIRQPHLKIYWEQGFNTFKLLTIQPRLHPFGWTCPSKSWAHTFAYFI